MHLLIFGEVANEGPDPGTIARYTRRDGYPAVLDFAFQGAVRAVLAQGKGTEVLADTFDGDVLYQGGEEAALAMPTFLGNHDMGRFSTLIRKDMPGISDAELVSRVELAHVMLMTLRGSPVIYYGDEQGFIGDGNDQDAREDMFASKVLTYNDNKLLGSTSTTAVANFDPAHPFYRLISGLAKLRKEHPALARGRQVTRTYSDGTGLFSVSRFDPVALRLASFYPAPNLFDGGVNNFISQGNSTDDTWDVIQQAVRDYSGDPRMTLTALQQPNPNR